jgi:hypothetical protein
MQQGMQQGEVKAKSEDVLKIIDSRAINVTAEQREQVTSCTDIAQLDEWFDTRSRPRRQLTSSRAEASPP